MKYWLTWLWYKWSWFNYGKCVDCKWDGVGDPYCKPPIGLCIFERKE